MMDKMMATLLGYIFRFIFLKSNSKEYDNNERSLTVSSGKIVFGNNVSIYLMCYIQTSFAEITFGNCTWDNGYCRIL